MSFEAFLEKLGPDVDPDVAKAAFLHWQDWVGIPDFPVMPEDTFAFYGCFDEDKQEECESLATNCGVDAKAFLEELNFTEKWQAYVPVETIGDAVRLISAWKRSSVVVPFPSMGNEILRMIRIAVNAMRILVFALPLGAWAVLGRWSWPVAAVLFFAVLFSSVFVICRLESWHYRIRRRAWELSRDANPGDSSQSQDTNSETRNS